MLYKGELYSYEVIGRFLWDTIHKPELMESTWKIKKTKKQNKKKHTLFHHWS